MTEQASPEIDPDPFARPHAHRLSWSTASGGTIQAAVFGGDYTVDTDALMSLADSLTVAANYVLRARDLVVTARKKIRHAANEPNIGMPGFWGIFPPFNTFIGASPTQLLIEQNEAISALNELSDGMGSLGQIVEYLQDLAADVRRAAQVYGQANTEVFDAWEDFRQQTYQALFTLSAPVVKVGFWGFSKIITKLPKIGDFSDSTAADAFNDLQIMLADTDLEAWACSDLLVLVWLAWQAGRAETASVAAQVETYLAHTAARLDPVISRKLPQQIPIGSRLVDTASLTPMQRISAYLATISAQAGSDLYGRERALAVNLRGSKRPTLVPSGADNPFGLRSAVFPLTFWGALPRAPKVRAPASASAVIRYSDQLKQTDTDLSSGVIALLRTDHADGTRSWLVLVPGTTDWGMGNSNPQDMLTNLQAVAGMPTDMNNAVVTAMRAAGVGESDPVALYGHSQGAITAAQVASDPEVLNKFNVQSLLTVGGPVAAVALPSSVSALHIENMSDSVPALDAAPNPVTPNRVTVALNTTKSGLKGFPHGSLVYAQALDGMPSDPALKTWNKTLLEITGAHESGAVTTELIFDVERLYADKK